MVPMEFTEVGQRFEVMEQPGEVLRFEPPRMLEWEWGGERFSFHLEPDGDATRLTFLHVFARRDHGADYASGWDFHLDRLQAHSRDGLCRRPTTTAWSRSMTAMPSASASTARLADGCSPSTSALRTDLRGSPFIG